ncbi:MAG: hypothetical protein HYY32_00235 [Chloroflexi bacterium]|nr:hypothetical protein [Chloroflexota bacterium]
MRFTAGNSAPRGLESGFASTGPNPLLGTALPEVDKLIKAIYSEPDPMKRKELIAQAIKATHETYVGFQICSAPSLLAVAPGMDISSWSLPLASPYFTTWAADIKHKE